MSNNKEIREVLRPSTVGTSISESTPDTEDLSEADLDRELAKLKVMRTGALPAYEAARHETQVGESVAAATETGFPWHDGEPDLHGGYWAPMETQYIRLLSSRKGQTYEAASDEAMDRLERAWNEMAGHPADARSRIVARVLEAEIRHLEKTPPIVDGDDITDEELAESLAQLRRRY